MKSTSNSRHHSARSETIPRNHKTWVLLDPLYRIRWKTWWLSTSFSLSLPSLAHKGRSWLPWTQTVSLFNALSDFSGLSSITVSEVHVIHISRVIITYTLESFMLNPETLLLAYSISQEICTRFLLCCALLWLYIDWFSHFHQAYFTGTVAI